MTAFTILFKWHWRFEMKRKSCDKGLKTSVLMKLCFVYTITISFYEGETLDINEVEFRDTPNALIIS